MCRLEWAARAILWDTPYNMHSARKDFEMVCPNVHIDDNKKVNEVVR